MAHRHDVQKRASGGGVMPELPAVGNAYSGGSSNVAKEAKERKFGGSVSGAKSATRMDRPGRKAGGRVGADKSPLSSAARCSDPPLKQMH